MRLQVSIETLDIQYQTYVYKVFKNNGLLCYRYKK